MAVANSKIEWTQATWSPVRGCSRVSPGCDRCYAMGQAHRFSGPGKPYEGLTTIRRGKVDWAGMARFVPEQLEVPLRRKKPTTYFVNSMSDLFHESLSNEEIAAVFGVMAACPQHTFQVLTKRPERALEFFRWVADGAKDLPDLVGEECPPETSVEASACIMTAMRWAEYGTKVERAFATALQRTPWPLPNVHLGTSAENQEQYLKRGDYLAQCPAAVRWFSLEPLLGPINLGLFGTTPKDWGHGYTTVSSVFDWFIVGGESGRQARPCEVGWVEAIVRECQENETPVFVKQLGAHVIDRTHGYRENWPTAVFEDLNHGSRIHLQHKKGGRMSEWPEHLRVRQFPEMRA